MSYLVFDIEWEGGADLPTEYTLENVVCPGDIDQHLQSIFEHPVNTFEYVEL